MGMSVNTTSPIRDGAMNPQKASVADRSPAARRLGVGGRSTAVTAAVGRFGSSLMVIMLFQRAPQLPLALVGGGLNLGGGGAALLQDVRHGVT